MSERSGTENILLSFLIGGAVGAGVALLFAPRSGKETRERIKNLAKEWEHKADELLQDGKSKVAESREAVKEKVDRLKDAYEAGRRVLTGVDGK